MKVREGDVGYSYTSFSTQDRVCACICMLVVSPFFFGGGGVDFCTCFLWNPKL